MDKRKSTARNDFIIASTDRLISVRAITHIDLTTLDDRYISVKHGDGEEDIIEGVHAIEALMLLKPSALEGLRMKWARQAWFVHNTFGHTYLATMSLIGLILAPIHERSAKRIIKHGIHVHDATVPKPKCF